MKVCLKALQETFTDALGFFALVPDCSSWMWEWTPVERGQEWMKST